jgi:biopolymer transport protein ExbB
VFSLTAICQPAGYDFVKEMEIESSRVAGSSALIDFPMLVSIIDPDLRTVANGGKVESSSGYDIVFTLSDCSTLLDHQIEKYVPSTGEYVAWLRIPSLSNSVNTTIGMYYGNSAIASDPSTTSTWNAQYIGVWHMSENPAGSAPQVLDYTNGSNNGTSAGGMTSGDLLAGKIGDAIDFDGSNDYIDLGDILIDGRTQISIEVWFNPTFIRTKGSPSGHNSSEGAIVHKNGASDDNLGITVATGGTAFYIDDNSNNTTIAALPSPSLNTWTHIVGTWNNSTMITYQNGVSAATLGSVNGSFVNNSNSLRFGGEHGVGGGNPHHFQGRIDEIRISSIARSADWVATVYNNESSPSTFYTFSTEMDPSTACSTILPIELKTFTAYAVAEDLVEVHWSTLMETNNDFFTLERSVNAHDWIELFDIEGAGNSNVQRDYREFDFNPLKQTSFYRLKQTDFNGDYSYSNTQQVDVLTTDFSRVQLFPNPTSNAITIVGSEEELEELELYDLYGKNVSNMIFLNRRSSENILIDLSKL